MPNLLFSICSELVSLDQITNNLDIIHIIENITSKKFPFTFPRFFISSLWQLEKGENKVEFEVRIQFVNPKNESKREARASWQTNQPNHRHIAVFTKLPIDIPGIYSFEICIRKKGEKEWGKPVFKIPLVVKKIIVKDKKYIH